MQERMTDVEARVEIPVSRWMNFLLFILALGFVLLGGWLTFVLEVSEVDWLKVKGVGIATMFFFGLGAVVVLKWLVAGGTGLVVSPDGVEIKAMKPSLGLVPWSNVSAVEEVIVNAAGSKQKFAGLFLHDPEAVLAPLGAIARKLAKANRAMTGTPVQITANNLKISHKDLLALLRRYHAAHG